ncbi:hypothetical protein [Mesorhizobium sp. M0590]|uniref:hypothetical protein n=1 Tax=unclassified Mesorhizobium TaxID=325217 RepID=UPI0033371803
MASDHELFANGLAANQKVIEASYMAHREANGLYLGVLMAEGPGREADNPLTNRQSRLPLVQFWADAGRIRLEVAFATAEAVSLTARRWRDVWRE